MAAGDLTTLPNVKAWLGQKPETTADDQLLERLITAASKFVCSWLGRQILAADYVETRDGPGGARIQLRQMPINSVASVAVGGQAIAPAVGATDLGYLFSTTSITLRGHCFTRGLSNVVIAYNAGFAEVPEDIAQACIELIGLRYRERDRIGYVSKTLAGETVTFSVKDMTSSIQTALMAYKAVVPS